MINYVIGDATEPIGSGTKIIAHICNDSGRWGAGFVKAISKKWWQPEYYYKEWYKDYTEPDSGKYFLPLGRTQTVPTKNEDLFVINMIAQHGTKGPDNPHPLSYKALGYCLEDLKEAAEFYEASIHMPRIGAGLAGGNWNIIESYLNKYLCEFDVTVYDLGE